MIKIFASVAGHKLGPMVYTTLNCMSCDLHFSEMHYGEISLHFSSRFKESIGSVVYAVGSKDEFMWLHSPKGQHISKTCSIYHAYE